MIQHPCMCRGFGKLYDAYTEIEQNCLNCSFVRMDEFSITTLSVYYFDSICQSIEFG